jgi:hypothetical protein
VDGAGSRSKFMQYENVNCRPFSQKTQELSEAVAQVIRSSKRDSRVPGVHVEIGKLCVSSGPVAFQAARVIGLRESSIATGANVNPSAREIRKLSSPMSATRWARSEIRWARSTAARVLSHCH